MPTIAPEVISYPVNRSATWDQAHSELCAMEEQEVTVTVTTTGPEPKMIGWQEGATLVADTNGTGIDAALTVWASGAEYLIEAREFRGAEVAPGFVAFVFDDYGLSFRR